MSAAVSDKCKLACPDYHKFCQVMELPQTPGFKQPNVVFALPVLWQLICCCVCVLGWESDGMLEGGCLYRRGLVASCTCSRSCVSHSQHNVAYAHTRIHVYTHTRMPLLLPPSTTAISSPTCPSVFIVVLRILMHHHSVRPHSKPPPPSLLK